MKAYPLDSVLAGQTFIVFKDPRRDAPSFLTPEKFHQLQDRIHKTEITDDNRRVCHILARGILGTACEVEIDENGVAWLPDHFG